MYLELHEVETSIIPGINNIVDRTNKTSVIMKNASLVRVFIFIVGMRDDFWVDVGFLFVI